MLSFSFDKTTVKSGLTLDPRFLDANAARSLLATVLDESADLLAVVNSEYRLIAFNSAFRNEFERIFRRRPAVGLTVHDALSHSPKARDAAIDACSRAIQGERFTVRAAFTDAHAQRVLYEIAFAPIAGARRSGAVLTIRRNAECATPESSPIYGSELDNTPLVVVELTPELHVVGWRGGAERLLGWTFEEANGKLGDFGWIHDEDLASFRNGLESLMRGESQSCIVCTRNCTKDRRTVPMEWHLSTVPDGGGRLAAILCLGRDLSQQRQIEQKLRDDQVRLRSALKAGQLGTWNFDLATNMVAASEGTGVLFALQPLPQLPASHYLERIHPDDRPRVQATLERAIAEEREYQAEYRIVHPDGNTLWVLARGEIARDEDGHAHRVVGVVIDLSQRKRSEEALRRAEQRYRVLFDANPIGILAGDVYGNILGANAALLNMIGYSREDVESGELRWTDITPPEWLALDWQHVQEAKISGVCTPYEKEYIRKDGTRIPVIVGYTLVGESREESVAFIMDITDRKGVERELLESKERLELAQMAGRAGIFDWDITRNRVIWSEQLERLFGLQPRTFEGRLEDWQKRVVPEDVERVQAAIQEAMRRREPEVNFEFRAARSDGQVLWLYGQASFFYDPSGVATRMIGVNIDITDRKRMEDELRRSNEDLSQFTYAVSHDLREPLRMMSAFSALLQNKYAEQLDEGGRQMTDYILQGARRMDTLINDLLAYSRIESSKQPARAVDSGAAVQAALVNLAGVLESAGATVDVRQPLPWVCVHAMHIVQLMQNLIGNAVKFRDIGRLPVIRISATVQDSEALFSIEDNGIGIDSRHLEYVFRMFKRLHSEREGTGIGLALCRKIVESYGCRIWVQSELGKGSIFFFTLPVTDEASET